jgi:hypothetical protein
MAAATPSAPANFLLPTLQTDAIVSAVALPVAAFGAGAGLYWAAGAAAAVAGWYGMMLYLTAKQVLTTKATAAMITKALGLG